MTHTRSKIIIAGVVLAAAVGYLTYAGIAGGTAYYMDVDAFLAGSEYPSQRTRVRGTVAQQGVVTEPGGRKTKFRLDGESHSLPVVYAGVLPDMFRPGAQVVVTGKLDGSGVFQADTLLTKCASKYTEGSPPHGPQGPKGAR